MAIKLLLAGYFGCGNLGDDAIFAGLIEALRGRGYEFCVLSGAPEESFRLYGVRAAPRRDFKVVEEEIKNCDALVFPGGSIFQDVTSVKSPAYYATLVNKAKKAGKKVIFLGQGVGPLKTFFGKRFASGAFKAADAIVVRDPASMTLLKDLGVRSSIQLGADTAFLLPAPANNEDSGEFGVAGMKTIGIAPRPFGRHTKAIIQIFGDLSRLLYTNNMVPVLIEMDHAEDRNLIAEIGKTQGGKIPDIRKLQTPTQVMQRMSRMDTVIAMRLHAGVLASAVGVPPYMVSYDPKVTAFAKLMELGTAPSIEGLTGQKLYDSFMAFHRDRDRHARIIERKRQEMIQLAQVNVETLERCLKGAAVST